ncbi:MAG: vWA domain-containing protein, partial [Planctomycetota bacterium]
MTFAAWPFLIALLAAAIPVVLHMVNRQKAKELPFSTLRFLRISVQKTRRRKRVHDLLLMLIRAAVLALIAVGLARPTLTNLSSLWGGTRTAVVIILDNSASMGMVDQGEVRFRTALSAAEQIMDELREGDQVALLLSGGPPLAEEG